MEHFTVGIDLKEKYSFVSYWKAGQAEPESLSTTVGTEEYQIPAGNVEELLKKAGRLLRPVGKLGEADAVVFSVKETSGDIIRQIKAAALHMGISEERLSVQADEESFCSYVLHQSRDIFCHQAALFVCDGESLQGHMLVLNQKRMPVLARVETQEDWRLEHFDQMPAEEKDAFFAAVILRMFGQRMVSSVFLAGDGFAERWYVESLQILCQGRRVFAGNNLFSKGACCRAAELAGEQPPVPYLFFGNDKIPCNVALRTVGSRDGSFVLIPAGANWYEAKAECEVILFDQPVVEVLFQPLQGENALQESILLDGLPERPPRTTRLQVGVGFTGAASCRVEIRDLGFGELFPATDLVWEAEVAL